MGNLPALQPAYYSAMVQDFLNAKPDEIYGTLSRHHAHAQERPRNRLG